MQNSIEPFYGECPPPLPSETSAVRAGWICVAIGAGTFWIFGFGFIFFSVAMVLAVVAMCKNKVKEGILLLVSTFATLVFTMILFFGLIIAGSLGVGAAAMKSAETYQAKQIPNSRF